MAMLIYGQRTATIGLEEVLVKCPICEGHQPADVMMKSRYFHIYWVPVMPVYKEANIICHHCGLKRYDVPVFKGLFPDPKDIRRKFRHPWYTYSILGLFVLIVLLALLS